MVSKSDVATQYKNHAHVHATPDQVNARIRHIEELDSDRCLTTTIVT